MVDTYGSYAFGFLHTSKRPEAAVAVLHNDALPFYQTAAVGAAVLRTVEVSSDGERMWWEVERE